MSIGSVPSSSYYDNSYYNNQENLTPTQQLDSKKAEVKELDSAFLQPYNDAVKKAHETNQNILNGN